MRIRMAAAILRERSNPDPLGVLPAFHDVAIGRVRFLDQGR
jgi:hypothetical protein